nr:PREDICTED: uncharacterized protein LOC105664337 isoform X1 [Megachile rotundata]
MYYTFIHLHIKMYYYIDNSCVKEYSTYRTTTYRTQLKNMVPIDELTPNAERSTLHVARFYKFSNWKFVTMIRIVRNRNSTPGRRVAYFWTLLDFPDSVDHR